MSNFRTDLENVLDEQLYTKNKIILESKRIKSIVENVKNDNNIFTNINKTKKDYNINSLKLEFTKNYNKKSDEQKKYYIYNFLEKKNIKNNEIIDNSKIKIKDYGETFKFKDDLYISKNVDNFNKITAKDLKFKEKKEGEFLLNNDKIYSYKKLSKVMYLDYFYKDKAKVFITLTLPSKFHKYKKAAGQNFIENENYSGQDFIENIVDGLEKLNEIHRSFYRLLKNTIAKIDKKSEIGFIKMLEPHKNLQGHLHSLFYINKEYIEIIEHVYNITIKKFELIQTKFEILKNAKSSTYLNKYLIKTTKDENRRYFSNIRFFTSSNFKFINQEKINIIYKYLSKNRPHLIANYKKSKKPLYYYLELLYKKNMFKFDEIIKENLVVNRKKLKNIIKVEKYNNKEQIKKIKKELESVNIENKESVVFTNYLLNLLENDLKNEIENNISFLMNDEDIKRFKKKFDYEN